MINQKNPQSSLLIDSEKEFSKSLYSWLAQYDEEDDFLQDKVSSSHSETIKNE